jgi:transposase
MISDELKSEIRRLFYVRHFTANAIASSLGIHRDTVMKAIELREAERIASESELDRFEGKIKETLHIYPKLQGTRIHQMLKEQGYTGSIRHLRRRLRSLRLPIKDRFYMKPSYIAGECAQVDWAHVGTLKVGKAERKLSAFVMVLAWSRRMFVYFTFDQKMETLLDCHVKAFVALGGVPRSILYDNMKTVVVERLGQSIRYHESLLEFCQHWLFQPSVCAPYQPQSKDRVPYCTSHVTLVDCSQTFIYPKDSSPPGPPFGVHLSLVCRVPVGRNNTGHDRRPFALLSVQLFSTF